MNAETAIPAVLVSAVLCAGFGFCFGILVDLLRNKDIEAVMWGAALAIFLPVATFIITYAALR